MAFVDDNGLAFFAKRPLEGSPWIPFGISGRPSGPISFMLDFGNCQYSHEQLFFEDGEVPGNLGLFDEGQVRSDSNYPGNSHLYEVSSRGFDDCIMRLAAKPTYGPSYSYYNLLPGDGPWPKTSPGEQYNCQDWAAHIRKEYKRLEEIPEVRKQCKCPPKTDQGQMPWHARPIARR